MMPQRYGISMGLLQTAVVLVTTTAVPTVPTVQLYTPPGLPTSHMPLSGLGTAFGFTPPGNTTDTYSAVLLYLQNGGRALHTAWMYCNQHAVGAAMADSGVPRSEIFLMSMIPPWHLGWNETHTNFQDSLKQLNTTYVDLYMFHWPGLFPQNLPMLDPPHVEACGIPVLEMPECKQQSWGWKQCRVDTWRAMVELQQQGKIRALGVSNFEVSQMEELMQAGHGPPAVNQMEFHVGYHDDYLVEWSKNNSVVMQAYSPFAGGELSKPGVEPLQTFATKYNVSSAQIALKFIAQRGVAMIPKASTTAYQLENMDLWGFNLTISEMAALGRLATPNRRGVSDSMSMMCIDDTQGLMARCSYLD
eukprot:m.122356 g.122356  ORF g.122356 m.122356 type:complete len:360 (+) comp28916_c0_seq3:187-1266(+)